jgi:protoheme IX farnesyltransferase
MSISIETTALPIAPAPTHPAGSFENETADGARSTMSAYLALTKPRIVVMVLLTVAVGYLLGARGRGNPLVLAWTLVGTALVAAGASGWNQVLERSRDARMRRTRRRPLPSGQITVWPAATFSTALTVVGVALLAWQTTTTAAGVALTTFLLYVAVYTPLKSVTTLNTAIGAVPGALPPLIGWAAATGDLGLPGWGLFLVVFLWQFPHFLAIAWIHRHDYARADLKMLPSVDPTGAITGRQAAGYALILVPGGLLPSVLGLAGHWYFAGALAAGLFYLAFAARFWFDVSDATARGLLRASIVYLPTVLSLLLLNPLPA